MSSIVFYTNRKTGAVTAYRSEAHWDPEKGYSVPKRTYLGIVDPVTKEIIPSRGKRGRPKKAEEQRAGEKECREKFEKAMEEVDSLRERVRVLETEKQLLLSRQTEIMRMMQGIQRQIQALTESDVWTVPGK